MADPAITIEPDELLGLSALAELEKVTKGGGADAAGIAKTLMHKELAAKLNELGLPWAPSAETVQKRIAEATRPAGPLRALMRSQRVRRYATNVLAAAGLIVLWGGYVENWQWTSGRRSVARYGPITWESSP